MSGMSSRVPPVAARSGAMPNRAVSHLLSKGPFCYLTPQGLMNTSAPVLPLNLARSPPPTTNQTRALLCRRQNPSVGFYIGQIGAGTLNNTEFLELASRRGSGISSDSSITSTQSHGREPPLYFCGRGGIMCSRRKEKHADTSLFVQYRIEVRDKRRGQAVMAAAAASKVPMSEANSKKSSCESSRRGLCFGRLRHIGLFSSRRQR
ncbi:Hypothetical protein SMAX5B_010578 [Scophthalmus maximus]|uniref:Uncharacterized protein n=1 Tax=Scophthalmus maximus TaxID=52904 RepID=A0A2U9B365_SCOMX|nr:Hypothetical protein SMAX5B_010578 [Scophthalmus maximus]